MNDLKYENVLLAAQVTALQDKLDKISRQLANEQSLRVEQERQQLQTNQLSAENSRLNESLTEFKRLKEQFCAVTECNRQLAEQNSDLQNQLAQLAKEKTILQQTLKRERSIENATELEKERRRLFEETAHLKFAHAHIQSKLYLSEQKSKQLAGDLRSLNVYYRQQFKPWQRLRLWFVNVINISR